MVAVLLDRRPAVSTAASMRRRTRSRGPAAHGASVSASSGPAWRRSASSTSRLTDVRVASASRRALDALQLSLERPHVHPALALVERSRWPFSTTSASACPSSRRSRSTFVSSASWPASPSASGQSASISRCAGTVPAPEAPASARSRSSGRCGALPAMRSSRPSRATRRRPSTRISTAHGQFGTSSGGGPGRARGGARAPARNRHRCCARAPRRRAAPSPTDASPRRTGGAAGCARSRPRRSSPVPSASSPRPTRGPLRPSRS